MHDRKQKSGSDSTCRFSLLFATFNSLVIYLVILIARKKGVIPPLQYFICSQENNPSSRDMVTSLHDTIHNQSVSLLPTTASCVRKGRGISFGMVCNVEDTMHFIKAFPYHDSLNEKSASADEPGIICYEEFNRQFVQHNIGVKVPRTRFFKQIMHRHGFFQCDGIYYIGSEAVADFQLFNSFNQLTDKLLGHAGVAKLAVVATFISDIHFGNFGYDKQGLVLIDVDSVNDIPRQLQDYLAIAKAGLAGYLPWLSLDSVQQMKMIYEAMQQRPLPAFHDHFQLTEDLYQTVLQVYIHACAEVIAEVKAVEPSLPLNSRREFINFALMRSIDSQAERYTRSTGKVTTVRPRL